MKMPIIVPALLAGFAAGIACAAPAAAADNPGADFGEKALNFGGVTVPARPPKNEAAAAATYERCMALARKDPAAGQNLAQEWHGKGGAHPAEHCLAAALIGLKQYKEAGLKLEALGQAMVHAPAALRAEVYDQAGQAWLMAGDAARAYAAGTMALEFAANDPDLLVDRAEAAGSAGWFDKAAADLDRVLKAHPDRIDALIYRASAYRRLDKLDAAMTDIEKAVRLAPKSAAALLERGDLKSLKGDAAGAKQDWQRAAALAPNSAAAAAANGNIARLDAK